MHLASAYREELAERIARAIPEDGTAMSPLQFQKQLRLQEARLFGQPPMRDLERLREAARR